MGSSSAMCHWMASSGEAASESSLDSSGLASSSSGSSCAVCTFNTRPTEVSTAFSELYQEQNRT